MKTIIAILAISATLVSCQKQPRYITAVNVETKDTVKVDAITLKEKPVVGHVLVSAKGNNGAWLEVVSLK